MEFTQDFADDLGAFAIRFVPGQPQLEHTVQDAPVHRLEAVAHVGKRAADNHAHRVVEIRLAHLVFNVDGDFPRRLEEFLVTH